MSENDSLQMGRLLYQLQERLASLKDNVNNLNTSSLPQITALASKVSTVETSLRLKAESLLYNILNSEPPGENKQIDYNKKNLSKAGLMHFKGPRADYVRKSTLDKKYSSYRVPKQETDEKLPSISEEEISRGMLNLINQGLIPRDVDLTPAFTRGAPPLHARTVQIHPGAMKPLAVQVRTGVPPTQTLKFDFPALALPPCASYNNSAQECQTTFHVLERPKAITVEPFSRGYEELVDEYSSHFFIIRKGKTLDTTPEFLSYKRIFSSEWDFIVRAIGHMERFLGRFGVPRAEIDGKRLKELLGRHSRDVELFDCINNKEEVRPYIRVPAILYQGELGSHKAATKIQTAWRCYKTYTAYEQVKFLMGKAKTIQVAFRKFLRLKGTRKQVALSFKSKIERWGGLQRSFKVDWESIRNKPRVEVHISSLSVEECRRLTMEKFLVRQNLQISRIFSIQDPSRKVIYVSAFDLNEEILSYYNKVLDIGGVPDPASRLTVISPNIGENIPTHISTTRALLYSPSTMHRLKQLIKHQTAYIVPGPMSKDELELSVLLGIPVLGGDPFKAALFSTKSGGRRIFTAAEVPIAPGAHDLYDEKEFLATLTRLVASNLYIDTWLFKIDNEFSGRGHACLDVSVLRLVKKLRKSGAFLEEQQQEKLYFLLAKALPKRVKIATPTLYRSWKDYMKEFVRVGGVIEATPVCSYRSTGSVTICFLIEPNGNIELVGAYDKLESRRFVTCGYSFPQTHLPNMNMKLLCNSIGSVLYQREIIGYVSVSLVSFPDETRKSNHPLFWGTDLKCHLSDVGAVTGFYDFLMEGKVDPVTGFYQADNMQQSRSFLYVPYIHHPGVGRVLYKTFFYMCRVQGISFDLEERKGTTFLLPDTLKSSVFGLLTIGKDLKLCYKYMREALDFAASQGATPLGKIFMREDSRDDSLSFSEIVSMVKITEKHLNNPRKKVI